MSVKQVLELETLCLHLIFFVAVVNVHGKEII